MNNFWAITGVAGGNFGGGAGEGRYQFRSNPSPPTALKCPRCNSANTKFCYYNNYNLAQPRYFCKACRRYWTKGGVLRNVPVGGGCRRSKRSSVSSSKCSAGLASEKDLLPSGRPSADGSNSVGLVSGNPDFNTNPEPDFNQATATETPSSLLTHEAEIFAETITSPVPVPTTLDFSSFSALPRISFRSRPMATGKEQIIAPTRFMHQAAMPIPLDHLLMEAQNDLRTPPGFMDQARLPPPPPIPFQFPQTTVEDVAAQPGFLDQALLAGMRWSGASADPTIYGEPMAEDPTAAAACWSHGHWDVADPALNFT